MNNIKTELIPLENIEEAVNIRKIRDNENQSIKDLADNIEETGGILSPVLVTKLDENKYSLFVGHRRFQAYRLLKEKYCGERYAYIPAIEKDKVDEEFLALSENIARQDMTEYEKAKIITSLSENETRRSLAEKLGISSSYVQKLITLYKNNGKETKKNTYKLTEQGISNITDKLNEFLIIEELLESEEKTEYNESLKLIDSQITELSKIISCMRDTKNKIKKDIKKMNKQNESKKRGRPKKQPVITDEH